MPVPVVAAAAGTAASAAGGTAAAGTAAAAGGAAAGTAAAGATAVGGTAATVGTATRAGKVGGKIANVGKNAVSKAGTAWSKASPKTKQRIKKVGANYAYNKYEEHQAKKEEEQELKGINPLSGEEEDYYEDEINTNKALKKGCVIGGCGCMGFGCVSALFIPVILTLTAILIPYAVVSWLTSVADVEGATNSTLASCERCTTEQLREKREQQWNDKLSALESHYGSKIDKAALVATVTYSADLDDVIALEYDEDYNESSWIKQASESLFSGLWDMTNGDSGQDFGKYSSENISLLQHVAEGMASSGDTYSDENYKKWLIDGSNNIFTKNMAYCSVKTNIESINRGFERFLSNASVATDRFAEIVQSGQIPWEYFTPKVFGDVVVSSTVGSYAYHWRDNFNVFRICEYGYIEGMIPGIYNISDQEQKKKKKEKVAQEIIDLAEYYRYSDELTGDTAEITEGSKCYYKVKGVDGEISDLQVRTILSESGNPEGTQKYQDIPGEGLVDFETYILGVVNSEVGGSSSETRKTQAVVARSFALTRGQGMAKPIGQISIENGQWILRIRTSTSDQVFCHPDLGCGSMSGSMQGTTSGADTVYAGGYNGHLTRQPIAEDASIREDVASTKGQVATKNGEVQYTNFAQSEQTSWENQAKGGKTYQEIVKSSYGYDVTSDCRGGGNLGNYDLEAYYNASQAASMPVTCTSGGKSLVDCTLRSKGKKFKSLAQFNEHIKQSIKNAGYGTREAVVAASIALIGDYSMDTGLRLKYTWGGGHPNEYLKEPVGDPFGLDCSGFIGWAIYQAGFKFSTSTTDGYLASLPHGKMGAIKGGKPGDFLVNSHHTVMIIGTYDDGYYVAEAKGTSYGMVISKLGYSGTDYHLFDMDHYYNNSKNKR